METFIILLVFIGVPVGVFSFIIAGAVYRAKQHKKVWDAAEKYLNS